jgi:hypothetical protein
MTPSAPAAVFRDLAGQDAVVALLSRAAAGRRRYSAGAARSRG